MADKNRITNFMEFRKLLLSKDLQIFNHLDDYNVAKYLKDKERESLVNNVDRIKNVLSDNVFFSDKSIKTDHNHDKNNISILGSNIFNDPKKQKADSAVFVDDEKMELGMIYNTCSQAQQDNLHAYMATVSFRSIDKGMLDLVFRGEKSEKSQRRLNSFKEMVRKLLDEVVDEFHIIGGIVSYEITVNKDKLKAHDGSALYHLHAHLMLLTDQKINIKKVHLHNGKNLNVNNYIMNKWSNLCKKYDKKNDSSIRKFDPQAFDIREAYSKKSNASFADTLTEELKYPTKPDYLSIMKDMEDEDGEEEDTFALEVFAELMGATYRNPSKIRFGLLRTMHQVTQGSSTLKSLVKSAMNSNPKFTISGKKSFGSVLTHYGKLTYVQGKERNGYWRHKNMRPMSDKEVLFQNASSISGALMSDKQLSWLKEAISTFDVTKMNGTKKENFDKILTLFDRLPYLHSIDDLTSWIDDVARSNGVKAMKYINKDKDSYDSFMGKFKDLHKFSKLINKYVDDKGLVHLGLHTSPNFKYRLSSWVSMYLGSLKDGYTKEGAWKFYAAVHNGYKDTEASFSLSEKTEYRRAMGVADGIFHYGEVAPQPREVASFDHVGCYFKVNKSHLGKNKKFNEDTGELLTIKDYNQLTASSNDSTCWSEDGTKFDFNLFAELRSFDDVARELRGALNPLIKKNKKYDKDKIKVTYRLQPKKMSDATK